MSVTTAVAPHAGITYTPIDNLRLSATFHSVQKVVLADGDLASRSRQERSHTR